MPVPREPLRRSEASILSPLRYPGAKRRLCGFISEALKLNGLKPRLLVEPFAGGASVSLQLLNDGIVENVALAETFQIRAVGSPQILTGTLNRTGGVIAQISSAYPDVRISVTPLDYVLVPQSERTLLPTYARPRL